MSSFAFVFPGQGSQAVGMLAETAKEFPDIKKYYHAASDILGYDLWQLTQQGPAEQLDQTVYTQPALLVSSYAIWQILKEKTKILPTVLAGHSLGEYTALLCADAFSFNDAVKLVAARGKFMQEAVPIGQGALAVIIGLGDEQVQELCLQAAEGEIVSPANYNSPGQVVIAGHVKAVERAMALAKALSARMVKVLPVSSPSHSVLMKPAVEKLKNLLLTIKINNTKMPVINNVDVEVYQNAEHIREGLVRQLSHPVRWVEIIQAFEHQGITMIIECGPGKILTGLNKRITKIPVAHTADLESLKTFEKNRN